MAETKTNSRGRKPKADSETTTQDNDMSLIIAQMQEQMKKMQEELEATKKEKEEAIGQNLDLQTLIDALKSNNDTKLPNYVTLISLVPNMYSLSTEPNGRGACYIFEELGDTKMISLNDVQKIIGVSKYRKQAENGFFYIVEEEVNDYLRLNQTTNTIDDIREILSLSTDDCVDKFLKLDEKLRVALADKMAVDISNGVKLDKNKLSEIFEATDIDIEEKARVLKKILNK